MYNTGIQRSNWSRDKLTAVITYLIGRGIIEYTEIRIFYLNKRSKLDSEQLK